MKGRQGLGLALGLSLLAASLAGCGAGGGALPGLDGQRGAVRVVVAGGAMGPVAGATVVLKKDSQPITAPVVTDGSGAAEFPAVPYGDGYRAFVNAHGFQTGVSGTIKVIGGVEVPVSLTPLHAAGTGMVVGSVKEVRGAPIANAQVAVAGRTTLTNAAGQFTFADVPPGQYPITVNAPGATLYQAPPAVAVVAGDVAEVPTIFVRGAGTMTANAAGSTYLIATPGRVTEFNRNWQAAWGFSDLGLVTGAVRLPSGETAVADASSNKVLVIDRNGQVVFRYGGMLSRLKSPNWLAADKTSGNLLITDTAGDQLIELAGRDVVWTSKGPWRQPRAATYTPRGTILVADTGNAAVAEIDRMGQVIWSFKGKQLSRPVHAQRLPNGNTLITDAGFNRILEVDIQGRYVWHYDGYTPAAPAYGGGYEPGVGTFAVRNWVGVMNGGEPPITTPGDPAYQDPGVITEPPVAARPAGALNSPRMAVRLSNGNTLIADTGNGRVLEVTAAGQIVWENGALGRPAVVEKVGDSLY